MANIKKSISLEEIRTLLNKYNEIGFKKISARDYKILANYYFEEILKSNQSIFDYGFNNYIPFSNYYNTGLKKLVNTFREIDDNKYQLIAQREDTKREDTHKIFQEIVEQKLDLIDYFDRTKLSTMLLDDEFLKYKRKPIIAELFIALNSDETTYEKQLKITYYTKGGVVSNETKKEVFEELARRNIPMKVGTYKALVRRKQKEIINNLNNVI